MTSLHAAKTSSTTNILKDGNSVADLVACSHETIVSKARRRRLTKLEIFLIVLLFIFLVALVVTIVFLVRGKTEQLCSDGAGVEKESVRPEDGIQILSQVLGNMDESVDPCKDFYQHACGGWVKKTFIDDSDVSTFPFKQVLKENQRAMKEILQSTEHMTSYSDKPNIIKVFHMYSSCMNRSAVEKFGQTELKQILQELGVFNITKNMSKSNDSYYWDEVVVNVKRKLNIDTFFTTEVFADIRDSSVQRIVIHAVSLGLAYKLYQTNEVKAKDDEKGNGSKTALWETTSYEIWTESESERALIKRIRQYYVEYMSDVMSFISSNNRSIIEQNMKDVLDLETKIAQTQHPPSQRRNFSLIYNLLPIHNISDMTSQFDWLSFYRSLTVGAGYTLDKNEQLLITSPTMVQDILGILNDTNSSVISNYIAWRIISGLIDVLPKKYGEAYNRFRSKIFNTDIQEAPRWQTCVDETSKALPLSAAILFVKHALPNNTIKQTRKIISTIKEVLLESLSRQSWLNKESETRAVEKVNAMIFHVGYPANMTSKDLMINEFSVSNESYFTTSLNVRSAEFMKNFESLRLLVDRNKYADKDPFKPGAFYFPTHNKVEIPVGTLHNPFYRIDGYSSFNYGTFGMVVGHEISHGFDQSGIRFDKYGRKLSATPGLQETYENVERKTVCCQNKIKEMKHGNLSFSSNVNIARQMYADIGGLKLAFEAYKTHKSQDKIFSELTITHDRLFFLSYVQMWCAKYKDIELQNIALTGTQLPFNLRTQATIRNSPEFAKVFNCPTGSPMNPEKKCEVW